jgi:hypothetical protein
VTGSRSRSTRAGNPLTGRKRYVSRQVPGKGRAALKAAKQVEAELLAEVGAGRHKGSRSRTVGELLERWYEWRQTVKPISPTTVMSYRGDLDRYILPALGKLPLRQLDVATLDTFYTGLRTAGGKNGRPLRHDRNRHASHQERSWQAEAAGQHAADQSAKRQRAVAEQPERADDPAQ